MPNVSVTLPEISQSVTRPVILGIIKQVQEITRIDDTSIIMFPGDSGKMQTPGSSIDGEINRDALFNTKKYTHIEVQEEYDLGDITTTAVNRYEQPAVFSDKEIEVYMYPVYAHSNVLINFKYSCSSKTEALRWRDDIRVRMSQMRDINLHDLNYHYLIPAEYLGLFREIHKNRQEILNNSETILEYITSRSNPRLVNLGNMDGSDIRLGIKERQIRIVGMYDFDGLPEKAERDDANGMWTISFGYRFSYDKPIACTIRYPIMVYNKLLPKIYVDFVGNAYSLDNENSVYSASRNALSLFESDTMLRQARDSETLIRLPHYDDFVINNVPYGTGSVILALSEVDKDDKRSLLNLSELGDIVLDNDILDFIRDVEYSYVTRLYQSLIHLSLYRNGHLAREDSLECDNALNVSATTDLNLATKHRVRLSLLCDITLVKNPAIDRLRQYPKAFVKIIGSIYEVIANNPDFQNLSNADSISNKAFRDIYALISGYAYDGRRNAGVFTGGNRANDWPYFPNPNKFFKDIDPNVLADYRANRTGRNLVQITGVVAFKMSDLNINS